MLPKTHLCARMPTKVQKLMPRNRPRVYFELDLRFLRYQVSTVPVKDTKPGNIFVSGDAQLHDVCILQKKG